MDINSIVATVDHTQLGVDTTWEQIKELCDEAIEFNTASVCIPPAYVAEAVKYVQGKVPVCVVIGFPNGYSTKASKVAEAKEAIDNGVAEVDMVINIGFLKSGRYHSIIDEIKAVKEACGNHILKVIVEACLLTEEEKIRMCKIITETGADFIKTSTGFSTAGATFEDIELFSKHIGPNVKIKAAGGIRSLEDAERFIQSGADRLGTSSIVRLLKNQGAASY